MLPAQQRDRLLEIFLEIVGGPVLRQRRLAHLRQKVAQPRLRLFLRLAWREPSEYGQPPVAAPIERALLAADDRLGAERRRDVEGAADLHAAEIALRDADDRERVSVELNRFADHVRAAAVFALPESITEDRDRPIRTAAAPIIVGREQAANLRRDAERVEEAAADEEPLRVARLAAGIQVEARVAVGADADQHLLVIADVLPLRVGQRGVGAAYALEAENHQPIRLVDRQRLEDQRVDQREDRDVGADAEGQREQRHAADDGRLPHLPDGELEVTNERRHESHAPFDAQHSARGWQEFPTRPSGWCQAPIASLAVGAWHHSLLTALEGEGGPGGVDRAHLVVHPAGRESGVPDDVAVEVRLHS